eukprot:UN3523
MPLESRNSFRSKRSALAARFLLAAELEVPPASEKSFTRKPSKRTRVQASSKMEGLILRVAGSICAKMSTRTTRSNSWIAFGPPSRHDTPGFPTIRKPVTPNDAAASHNSLAIFWTVKEMKVTHWRSIRPSRRPECPGGGSSV